MSDLFSLSPCAKGPIPYCLDELSTHPDARTHLENLRAAVEGLRTNSFRGLERVFEKFLFEPAGFDLEKRSPATKSLEQHWFDERSPDAYFPNSQPIAPIYAAGVLKTLELSLKGKYDPIPIDAWWVIGFSHVELINLVNSRQVTLLIATPVPPHPARKLLGDHTEAWTTVRGIVTRRL